METAMFAVVRTGGKQYRVAAGDKIVVEKLAGEAGDTIQLGEVLLAGEGSDLQSTDGLTVSAEIIAQAKGEKVIVFKKRRRHNYRRKNGHRQQHTILRILGIGDQPAQQSGSARAEAAPAADTPAIDTASNPGATADAPATEAKKPRAKKAAAPEAPAETEAHVQAPLKVDGAESEMTDTPVAQKPSAKKGSTKKPAADKEA
jgi:large subunit ribosomal protein L21